VSLLDSACIDEAVEWQEHAAKAAKWLRVSFDSLEPTERLHFSREIARAKVERNKALDRLGLDREEVDPWAAIDVTPTAEQDNQSYSSNATTTIEGSTCRDGCAASGVTDDTGDTGCRPDPPPPREDR